MTSQLLNVFYVTNIRERSNKIYGWAMIKNISNSKKFKRKLKSLFGGEKNNKYQLQTVFVGFFRNDVCLRDSCTNSSNVPNYLLKEMHVSN